MLILILLDFRHLLQQWIQSLFLKEGRCDVKFVQSQYHLKKLEFLLRYKLSLNPKDLDNLISLDVDHISIYSLIVSKGTMFYNRGIKEQNEDESREYYDVILNKLRKHGYERYEVSNFARNKKYSRHNLVYWHNKQYVGVGLGTSGYIDNVRYTNTRNLKEYLKGNYIDEKDIIDETKHLEDYLLTNLRLEKGFLLKGFEETFGYDFYSKFKETVDDLVQRKLLIIDKSVHLTDDGLIILDYILLKFLKEIH